MSFLAALFFASGLLADTTLPPPSLSLPNLQKQTQTLADYRGKIVVFSFLLAQGKNPGASASVAF